MIPKYSNENGRDDTFYYCDKGCPSGYKKNRAINHDCNKTRNNINKRKQVGEI